MKINLYPFEKLEQHKFNLREKLHIPENVQIEVALDLVHGLNELTRSVAQLHPHKISIAILGPQPQPIKDIIKGFSTEGFVIQELPVSFMNPDEKPLAEAWEKLKKDTLFVLGSAVEPLTGCIYPFEWIRREAPKKNIFSLMYYSPDALKKKFILPSTPWEGIVADPLWDEEHTLSLVLKGERCQGEGLLWGVVHFSEEGIKLLGDTLMSGRGEESSQTEDKTLVQRFEKDLSKSLNNTVVLLPDACARIFDRAVLFINGVNGDALLHKLKELGFETMTGAACSWNSPYLNNWLPPTGISIEMVQTSLIVPLKTLHNAAFSTQLLKCVSELRKISNFK
ncbi:MAG: hypothetical protein SGI74_08695 [Oligoflexia bacterium]|nr:hypothetical protein [Oligoflexia bacterium]